MAFEICNHTSLALMNHIGRSGRVLLTSVVIGVLCTHAVLAQESMPFRNPDLPLDTRVADLVSRLSLEEKAAQMGYEAPAIPRLGIPAYNWWSEALHGVARSGIATVFPQAIGLAATWDTDLMHRVATVTSMEARAKYAESVSEGHRGIYEGLTFFSPNINIFRDPRWGRGQETYGEDPYLTGQLAVQFIRGMQGDDPRYFRTIATAKHYAVHSGPEPERHIFDAVVSERDFRETYLPAFEASVIDGGVFSVMCAYNRVYGDPACGSTLLLSDILRGEWGFPGYVVSDCWALTDFADHHNVTEDETESVAMALRAGTDIACGPEYNSLVDAVHRGLITEDDVDAGLTRLLRARFKLGLFDPPERVPYASITPDANNTPEHHALAKEAAIASMVLLRNEGGVLPLRRGIRKIAVIGPNAEDVEILLGNYNGIPSDPSTPLEGIRSAARTRGIDVVYARGSDVAPGMPALEVVPASAMRDVVGHYYANQRFQGSPFVERQERTVDHEWWRASPAPGMAADSFSVRWTGTLVPSLTGRYALGVRALGGARLFLDDSLLVEFSEMHVVATHTAWADLEQGVARRITVEYSDRRADAAVQLVWGPPIEGLKDRAVEAASGADVAVMFLGLSPRLEGEEMPVQVPGFDGGDRVTLGLPAPQQELLRAVVATGTPTVLVLLNGSALAIPWAADHVPAILEAWYPGQAAGDAIAAVLFGDASPGGRLPVTVYRSVRDLPAFDDYGMAGRTYRYFKGDALFPFGHGLSYATFRYRDLRIPAQVRAGDDVEVSVEVQNAGSVAADEVVQLYVTDLEASVPVPVRSLAGFRRISLQPGEAQRVSFTVSARHLSVIDGAGNRLIEPGSFEISVGGKQPGQHGVGDAATTEVVTGQVEVVR